MKSVMDQAAKAKALGLIKFEGSPCRACGNTTRYASNASCIVCQKRQSYRWIINNRKKHRGYANASYKKRLADPVTREEVKEKRRIYFNNKMQDPEFRELQRQRAAVYHKKKSQDPLYRERGRKNSSRYYYRNREKILEAKRAYTKAKKNGERLQKEA